VAERTPDRYMQLMQARMYALMALILPIRAPRGSRLGQVKNTHSPGFINRALTSR
jgi:hypothetical protein